MFSVEINDQAVTAALMRASAAMENMEPLFWDIGEILLDSTLDRFKAGVSPEGVKWAPKSQTTLNRAGARKSNRVDVRPLFGPSGMLSTQISYRAQPDQVEISSNRPYAAMMQFGGTKARFPHLWGDIPARPFFGISETDSDMIARQIGRYMSGTLG
jgi:phage virion morphogenesis protein